MNFLRLFLKKELVWCKKAAEDKEHLDILKFHRVKVFAGIKGLILSALAILLTCIVQSSVSLVIAIACIVGMSLISTLAICFLFVFLTGTFPAN